MPDLGTVTHVEETFDSIQKVTWTWLSEDGGANAGKAQHTTAEVYTGKILRVVTVPDGVAVPTVDYDLYLLDDDGYDVGCGQLINRSDTLTQNVTASMGVLAHDHLTLSIENAGNATVGTVVVYLGGAGEAVTIDNVDAILATAPRLASHSVASLANGATTIFTFTGAVEILRLWGLVTTGIQDAAVNYKLNIVCDALVSYDICGDLSVRNFGAGSLLSITGTAANAMVGTTVVGAIAPAQANSVIAACIASGVIQATASAARTGVVTWYCLWRPLTSTATLV